MPFQPTLGQFIEINSVKYRFTEHPNAPGIAYGQEGRQATVYQLRFGKILKALKVFKSRFSTPSQVNLAEKLEKYSTLDGLSVCARTVLSPQKHRDLLKVYPDLTYAILMPWIEGKTWVEFINSHEPISPDESLALAKRLSEILLDLETKELAHCDLSGANLIIKPGNDIELVDVEGFYAPDLTRPQILPAGSPGYAHSSAPDGLWSPQADRFAGAILLAEILGWCDERITKEAWGESYFNPRELQQDGKRYQILHQVLEERWGEGIANLFTSAWQSSNLSECPTFGMWQVVLPDNVKPLATISQQVNVAKKVRARTSYSSVATSDKSVVKLSEANRVGTRERHEVKKRTNKAPTLVVVLIALFLISSLHIANSTRNADILPTPTQTSQLAIVDSATQTILPTVNASPTVSFTATSSAINISDIIASIKNWPILIKDDFNYPNSGSNDKNGWTCCYAFDSDYWSGINDLYTTFRWPTTFKLDFRTYDNPSRLNAFMSDGMGSLYLSARVRLVGNDANNSSIGLNWGNGIGDPFASSWSSYVDSGSNYIFEINGDKTFSVIYFSSTNENDVLVNHAPFDSIADSWNTLGVIFAENYIVLTINDSVVANFANVHEIELSTAGITFARFGSAINSWQEFWFDDFVFRSPDASIEPTPTPVAVSPSTSTPEYTLTITNNFCSGSVSFSTADGKYGTYLTQAQISKGSTRTVNLALGTYRWSLYCSESGAGGKNGFYGGGECVLSANTRWEINKGSLNQCW